MNLHCPSVVHSIGVHTKLECLFRFASSCTALRLRYSQCTHTRKAIDLDQLIQTNVRSSIVNAKKISEVKMLDHFDDMLLLRILKATR